MGVDVKSTEPLYSHKSVCTNPAAIGRLRQALQVPQLLKECCSWVDHYFQTEMTHSYVHILKMPVQLVV